ncbi:MAG: DUF4062 domain-containing protein [Bryobacterales bacterium]|nr:DUF4062 domain-containing protein [Bryobacterales bacterium]
MPNASSYSPRLYSGVMVSSTFTDLKEHRAALIKAIEGQALKAVAMENDAAKPWGDLIESSLKMVRDAVAYVGVISHKYGQTEVDSQRNPAGLSLTEMEFREAQRLGRLTLIFVMGDDHPISKRHVETDPVKIKKLEAFRELAKKGRIYAEFNSLDDFRAKAIQSVAELRRVIEANPLLAKAPEPDSTDDPIPKAPAFYAEPRYIGSHQFIGRREELDRLSDWAAAADPHPLLLFEAIGGTGKSMLTWEWTTGHAMSPRSDWAGRFWYSFYERGAIMSDFCRLALAYITGEPIEYFQKQKIGELRDELLHHLQSAPYLLVLDGLERVLVAYHRADAAQVSDEEANDPTDQIARRDPRSAIRYEDDELLRALAGAAPSKILITSRLAPRVLLNQVGQPIPGALRFTLQGLRPVDAEALLRSCGIRGDSQAIQTYLKTNCDCHPLVIGVLSGLINDYLPDRGNFDAWAAASQLRLDHLDLVQKRNHILHASVDALSAKSRELLSTLALLSESVDYATLAALNPHVDRAARVPEPEKGGFWNRVRSVFWTRNEAPPNQEMEQDSDHAKARANLVATVGDLERRGLLQYDPSARRYDLHPVVRSVASGRLAIEERDCFGQRVVDHFSKQSHPAYSDAETMADVFAGVSIVRVLIKMDRYQQACEVLKTDLGVALIFNLDAASEVVALCRPFFPGGWAAPPRDVTGTFADHLTSLAMVSLLTSGANSDSESIIKVQLERVLKSKDWKAVSSWLISLAVALESESALSMAARSSMTSLGFALLSGDAESIFLARMIRFRHLFNEGNWQAAQEEWDQLDRLGRNWHRAAYRPGEAEERFAEFCLLRGMLTESILENAEQTARKGRSKLTINRLLKTRGLWHVERGAWRLAASAFDELLRNQRSVGRDDIIAESWLSLARFHLGELKDARLEMERLSSGKQWFPQALAELALASGDTSKARTCADAAYRWAWAEGEPHVRRWELQRASGLIAKLGMEPPKLPPYDPSKGGKYPLEDEVNAALAEARAEKKAQSANSAQA